MKTTWGEKQKNIRGAARRINREKNSTKVENIAQNPSGLQER